jgi:hypothetical protein
MARKNLTSERLRQVEDRLTQIEERLRRVPESPTSFWARWLEFRLGAVAARGLSPVNPADEGQLIAPLERAIEPWKYLVRRAHPWRKQLYLKGRNLTARQLVGGIRANQFDEPTAATNYRLPVEAVREALAYVAQNAKLLEEEAEIELLMLKREGVTGGPRPVS